MVCGEIMEFGVGILVGMVTVPVAYGAGVLIGSGVNRVITRR